MVRVEDASGCALLFLLLLLLRYHYYSTTTTTATTTATTTKRLAGMRLDAKDLRYVTPEEFRVLKAAETGSLSHEVVPSTLIASTSGLHHAGLNKIMSDLARRSLIAREKNIKYDGWRLTYGGYDWLAVRALREKDALLGVGTRMGVGKESGRCFGKEKGS